MNDKIKSAFTILLASFFVYVIYLFAYKYSFNGQSIRTNLLALFLSITCIIIYKTFEYISLPKILSDYFWVVLIVCAAVPRLLWIFNTDISPISDFNLYHKTAMELINGNVLQKDYIAIFPHVIGYPFVLSFLYRVFGASVIVAQLFNVGCSIGISITIYYICKGWLTDKTAKVSAVLCSIWVSQIFYSTIISTEALFTFLFCICVLLYTMSLKQRNWYVKIGIYSFMGIFAAISNAVRPLALIFLVAVMIHTFIKNKNPIVALLKRAGLIMSMLICYLLVNMFISASIEHLIGIKPASNSFGYTFLVGSNISSEGGWNKEDADYMFELYNSKQYTLSEINSMLIQKATQRIGEDFPKYTSHYLNKNEKTWLNDSYGIDWNRMSVEATGFGNWNGKFENIFVILSNAFYQAMIFLTLLGLILTIFSKEKNNCIIFFIILLIGFIGANILTEVQARYHYSALPFLAICSAYGIQKLQYIFDILLSKNESREQRRVRTSLGTGQFL